jgi:protein-S-isoprenylcysteine O-methyltransferase Ste14
MKKRLKINGVIAFTLFLLIVAFPVAFLRQEDISSRERLAEIIGIALILLGQLIRVSSRGYKSEHSKNGIALIQSGPYSLVRNPMYLGVFLIGLGIVLMLFRLWVMVVFLLFFVTRYLPLIFKEEKKLQSLFPVEYPAYYRNVPYRIMPALSTLINKEIAEYMPLRLPWIKKEIGPILAVLFLALLLKSWEDIRHSGIRAYLQEAVGVFAVIVLFMCLVCYLSWRTAKLGKNNDSDKGQNNL